jgi:hypothetical protein
VALRLEGSRQLNEVIFQIFVDSFPIRNNFQQVTDVVNAHATDIEALLAGDPASGAEVVSARDQEGDLGTAIRKADELVGDGVERNVLDDFEVVQNTVADDKVKVKTGSAVIGGIKVRKDAEQSVDPPDFSLGITDPRIDVIHVASTGTAGSTTGTPAATPLAERKPDNTVELARLFLRPSGANPNVPSPIKDTDDGSNSFIMKHEQRFLEQKDDQEEHSHVLNILENGAGLILTAAGAPQNVTGTNLDTLERSATEKNFGDFSIRIVGAAAGAGLRHAAWASKFVPSLQGLFVTVSCYIKLKSGTVGKTARITAVQTGDSPAADFSAEREVNDREWTRLHVSGFMDNETTALDVRVEADKVDSNTTEAFIDGVQLQLGKVLTEFEFPPRVGLRPDGSIDITDLSIVGDLTVGGDAAVTGDLSADGVADTDDALVAYAALSNTGS